MRPVGVWSIGWDHRSLILMVRDRGAWQSYRLPKASHAYDGAHGWNTEWPRIRDIGEDALLMTMHGSFWRFPKTFRPANSAGVAPRGVVPLIGLVSIRDSVSLIKRSGEELKISSPGYPK